jgi:pimeloyl-ACP methyl ester carboxylesterase
MAAYALDQRGHGDSQWIADGAYRFEDYAADAAAVARELTRRHSMKPVVIGASLGGIAALLAEGKDRDIFAALVLVDITPRVDPDGVAKIHGFMRAYAKEGFATIADAAQIICRIVRSRKAKKG